MIANVILWPADVSAREGICYGWTRPLVCVAGVLPPGNRLEAENTLHAAVSSAQWRTVRTMFSSDPVILGACSSANTDAAGRLPTAFALTLDFPAIRDAQLVLYRRHKRHSMRFYAFDFSEIDILPSQSLEDTSGQTQKGHIDGFLASDFTRKSRPAGQQSASFNGEVLSQVNLAQFLAALVGREAKISDVPPSLPGTPDLGVDERPVPLLSHQLSSQPSVQGRSATLLGMAYRLARMISTTAEQFDVRYEQATYVYEERPYVYNDKARTVRSISKYIKFHNCIWLVLNDVIIGAAFGSFLCENQHILAQWLHYGLETYLVEGVKQALLWLNNWPAGLKLNTELSQFYCHTLVGAVSIWGWVLGHAAPYFPSLIWIIGATGYCGMTAAVSLLSDALSLLTAHLYLCYFISATVFSNQLSLASSLWNLFRGKRYNVLRNRIDTWDYDLDQLLLGTILFTLLAFLSPTVFTYYALFAMARLAVIVVHASFDTVTALLNHFPLFALLLRVKDPLRLPGGVCIRRSSTGPLVLASQPAPLSSIFRHYAHLAARLASHYHPLRMLRQLASGRLLNPIPRASVRYSMIPADRVRREGRAPSGLVR